MKYDVVEREGKDACSQALNLWLRVFGQPKRFKEKCSWYYGFEKNKSKIYLLQAKGGQEVFGAISHVHREFIEKRGEITLGYCADFAIEEKHRVLGPAILLLKSMIASQEKSIEVIYGFPNNRAVGVMCRAGFSILNEVSRYALILNSKHYTDKSKFSYLMKPISLVLNPAIKLYIKIVKTIYCSEYKLAEETEADSSFDELWGHWTKQSDKVVGRRDKEYIKWRFLDNPLNNFRLFTLRDKVDHQLTGYAIFVLTSS